MGEEEWRVHRTGAPSLDHLRAADACITREQLESRLGSDLSRPTTLVAYHPVTLLRDTTEEADALFAALELLPEQILFCYPERRCRQPRADRADARFPRTGAGAGCSSIWIR